MTEYIFGEGPTGIEPARTDKPLQNFDELDSQYHLTRFGIQKHIRELVALLDEIEERLSSEDLPVLEEMQLKDAKSIIEDNIQKFQTEGLWDNDEQGLDGYRGLLPEEGNRKRAPEEAQNEDEREGSVPDIPKRSDEEIEKARVGLVPKRVQETVHRDGKVFSRTRTVYTNPYQERFSEMRPKRKGEIFTPAGSRIPPAWLHTLVAQNKKSPLQAIGQDAAGRLQYLYSAKYSQKNAAAKFKRIQVFAQKIHQIQAHIDKDAPRKEEALILYIISKTGFRIGSNKETLGKAKAYGISTMLGQHISINGDNITFDFIGKKGVHIQKTLTDSLVARALEKRKKSDNRPLFEVNDYEVRKYLKAISGNKFSPKDFRTHIGTSVAFQELKGIPPPKTQKEFKSIRKHIGEVVSQALGNTPSVALSSYVAPEVFTSWAPEYAIAKSESFDDWLSRNKFDEEAGNWEDLPEEDEDEEEGSLDDFLEKMLSVQKSYNFEAEKSRFSAKQGPQSDEGYKTTSTSKIAQFLNIFEKAKSPGLVPVKVQEVVHKPDGSTFRRTTTVWKKPEESELSDLAQQFVKLIQAEHEGNFSAFRDVEHIGEKTTQQIVKYLRKDPNLAVREFCARLIKDPDILQEMFEDNTDTNVLIAIAENQYTSIKTLNKMAETQMISGNTKWRLADSVAEKKGLSDDVLKKLIGFWTKEDKKHNSHVAVTAIYNWMRQHAHKSLSEEDYSFLVSVDADQLAYNAKSMMLNYERPTIEKFFKTSHKLPSQLPPTWKKEFDKLSDLDEKDPSSYIVRLIEDLYDGTSFGQIHRWTKSGWEDSADSGGGLILKHFIGKEWDGNIRYHTKVLNDKDNQEYERYILEELLPKIHFEVDDVRNYVKQHKQLSRQILDMAFPNKDTITLYRGTSSDEIDFPVGRSKKVIVRSNPISSWTLLQRTAHAFADETDGLVIKTEVPKDDIWSFFYSHAYQGNEREVLLIGKEREAEQVEDLTLK